MNLRFLHGCEPRLADCLDGSDIVRCCGQGAAVRWQHPPAGHDRRRGYRSMRIRAEPPRTPPRFRLLPSRRDDLQLHGSGERYGRPLQHLRAAHVEVHLGHRDRRLLKTSSPRHCDATGGPAGITLPASATTNAAGQIQLPRALRTGYPDYTSPSPAPAAATSRHRITDAGPGDDVVDLCPAVDDDDDSSHHGGKPRSTLDGLCR